MNYSLFTTRYDGHHNRRKTDRERERSKDCSAPPIGIMQLLAGQSRPAQNDYHNANAGESDLLPEANGNC